MQSVSENVNLNEDCLTVCVTDKYGDGNLTSNDACELFRVTGVPTIVIVHPEGMLLTKSGLFVASSPYPFTNANS